MAKKPTSRKSKKTSRKTPVKKKTVTKKTAKKVAARASKKKKTTTKKTAARSTKKKTATRSGSKKSTTKKTATRKTTAKKTSKKPAAKKTTTKKTTRKVAPKKKTTTKKAATKKSTSKKTTQKKTTKKTASKGTTKKVATKKGATKKVAGKKATTKKTAAKTSTKKKTTTKSGKGVGARSVAEVASSTDADNQGYVFINGRRVRMISTSVKPSTRKPAAEVKPEAMPTDTKTPKEIKTSLSKKELNHYRNVLLIKRAELVGDLSSLETEALRSSGGDVSHMPIHMADIGSDTYEQDFMLGLAESERQRLREIDDALARIENKTYGVCQMTGKPIPHQRLEAKPWAKYTIEAARQLERGWGVG